MGITARKYPRTPDQRRFTGNAVNLREQNLYVAAVGELNWRSWDRNHPTVLEQTGIGRKASSRRVFFMFRVRFDSPGHRGRKIRLGVWDKIVEANLACMAVGPNDPRIHFIYDKTQFRSVPGRLRITGKHFDPQRR